MSIKPNPGFKALEFKEEAQARVQKELKGLSPEERIKKIQEDVETGPYADWWKRAKAAHQARLRAELDRQEREEAA